MKHKLYTKVRIITNLLFQLQGTRFLPSAILDPLPNLQRSDNVWYYRPTALRLRKYFIQFNEHYTLHIHTFLFVFTKSTSCFIQ